MQTHIESAFEIIDNYLPDRYVSSVMNKLPKNHSINASTIRNVRLKKSNRVDIINAMVEVALENKKQLEHLKKQIA